MLIRLVRTLRSRPEQLRARRGQSMVEFALVGPLLFLMLFGMVDFGRAIFYSNEITNAAREGARIAVLASNPCNTVIGNPSSNCSTSAGTGLDVCNAIKAQVTLISTSAWGSSCSDTSGQQISVPPCTSGCTANANNAYVEIDGFATSPSFQNCSTASSASSRATPRAGNNQAVKVTIVYYYRPLTPVLSQFFPSSFYLSSSVCARSEW